MGELVMMFPTLKTDPDGARRAVSTGSHRAALAGFTQGLGARVERFLV